MADKVIARISNKRQLQALEKLLNTKFPKAKEKRLIGGKIVILELYDENTGKDIPYYAICTKPVRHTDKYYDYRDWEELMIVPNQGVDDQFVPQCEPIKKDGGTPCDGGGTTHSLPNTINVAKKFDEVFGTCPVHKGTVGRDINHFRKIFGLKPCK